MVIVCLISPARALAQTAQASPKPDPARTTYLRECVVQGAEPSRSRAYCDCTYQLLRLRYGAQHYGLLDTWIRNGPPEVRRFAVLAWDPEFARCRPLLQTPAAQSGAP